MRRAVVSFGALVAIVLAAAGSAARAQAPGAANARVDAIFETWNRPDSPGCALGVIQNGRFVYTRGYGMANLDYAIPNSPTMVYYVGSVSKQFTAAAVALLAAEGRIPLDDPVRRQLRRRRSIARPSPRTQACTTATRCRPTTRSGSSIRASCSSGSAPLRRRSCRPAPRSFVPAG